MFLTVIWFLFVLQTADFNPKLSNTSSVDSGPKSKDSKPGLNLNVSGVNPDLNASLHASFSGKFEFKNVSGIRVFSLEQEMESRIIGGEEAWAHSWPWQVSLQFRSVSACGGAIITPEWIISAAHCFKRFRTADFWKVLAGKHDLENPKEPGQQLVSVSSIVVHPSYSSRNKDSDLALLKLQEPLVFDQYVRPINIWRTELPVQERCCVTGWGSTRENGPRVHRLQEVNVTVLDSADCNRLYPNRMLPSMFCAGRKGGGADACQGDSGGPLSCFSGSRYELAGIVSWGIGCGRSKRPGVYTKVKLHTEWIYSVLNNPIKTSADELAHDEDEQCGVQISSCSRPPGPVFLSHAPKGGLILGNVSEACPFFWPWQVSLQNKGQHYCSGTLLHPLWVITAKHCSVRPQQDMVVLGVHDLQFASSQSVPVDKVFHPKEDDNFPPTGDLSLIRLSVPARIGSRVSPVCVPDEDEELDDSWNCFSAGWGNTEALVNVPASRLHHTKLSVVNETECNRKWSGLTGDSHVCSEAAGSASCMGDPGAPLLCRKRSRFFLFGVLTWGNKQCDSEKPAVYTRIADYQSWISDLINK